MEPVITATEFYQQKYDEYEYQDVMEFFKRSINNIIWS